MGFLFYADDNGAMKERKKAWFAMEEKIRERGVKEKQEKVTELAFIAEYKNNSNKKK